LRLTWSRDFESEDTRFRWNELVSVLERPEIFYTWEWAEAARTAFSTSLEPLIATAYDDEKFVGVVALAKTSPHEATFLSGTTADYCDFISPHEWKMDFVTEVLRSLKAQGIRKIILPNLPADSATVPCIRESKAFHSLFRDGYQCSSIRLGTDENRSNLSRSFTHNRTYRQSLKAWEKQGCVRFEHQSTPDEEALEEFFLMHVCRFLRTGRISNLVTPHRRRFLIELAQQLGRSQWFDLMTLRIGEQTAACHFGFRFASSWFWYLPTINNDFEKHSPGHSLLTKFATEACDDANAERVDLGLGDESYKDRFANDSRLTHHVTLSRQFTDHLLATGRQHAVATIKRRPRLESAARRGRSGLDILQKQLKNGVAPALFQCARHVQRRIVHSQEVAFFQWHQQLAGQDTDERIVPMTWNILGEAAMDHWDDPETLHYLVRAAARFQQRIHSGYALIDSNGEPHHFAWVAPFDDFRLEELGLTLEAPGDSQVLIFDCWTPRKLRRHGFFRQTIQRLASQLSFEGCEVWMFADAGNEQLLAGIRQAQFRPQFSMVRRTVLGRSRVSRLSCENDHDSANHALTRQIAESA
jgi:CelD/BcsL family acetyltransferase involved in cellulose biosynthesis